nr:uncharacterized protein LOC109413112 isoform X1 [Aedes albopictus]
MSANPSKKTDMMKLSSTDKIDTPLYKKKTFDFTDYAYREAVNRLKFLLTEAYEPAKAATSIYYRGVDDARSEASIDNQSVIERPSITEVSKFFSPGTVTRYQTGPSGLNRRYSFMNKDFSGSPLKPAMSTVGMHPAPSVCSVSQNLEVVQPPPELLGFIEKQESYIEQLEKESQYCREELSTLLKKVKDVVSENEALTDRARSKAFVYQADSSESDDLDLDRTREKSKLSGPSIVFESRISELEAQLAQSQIDLKKLFNENEENKRKLVHGSGDASNADVYRKQVENLQRDKHNLEENVRKLQLTIDQLKDSEASNFSKSQRSRDMIEHVAFERNQAEIEIRRLKDELERQHERVREVQHEMAKRLSEERSNAERRYTFQVDQLGGDLSSQWEQATKLQLEVERMKRIESDYKRELNQKNSQIDELKMELKNKTAIFMSDLNQASAEKQSLEQEITSLRLQLERSERQSKVEVSRLNAEITSLRQRLDRSDADLLHSKRENLKLSDEVASLEKELTLGELNKETRPSKELAKIISDMEAKHAATVSELEGMVQDQKQLMDKLTAECKSLTHKLEDTSLQHKNEKKELRQTNNELMERLKQVWANYKEISPAFQKRKYNTDQLEADSNLSSASNHDSEPPRLRHDPAVPLVTTHSLGQQLSQPPMMDPTNHLQPHIHQVPVKPHVPALRYPIDSTAVADNNQMPSCLGQAPSTTTTTSKAANSAMRNEATLVYREHRSPMRTLHPRCKERSRSLDVLTRNGCPELVTVHPLNRTAPAVVADCHGNQSLAVTGHPGNRLEHNLALIPSSRNPINMHQKQDVMSPWNSINHQQPINTHHNHQETWSNPINSPMMRMPNTINLNTTPLSNTTNPNTRDMETNSTFRNPMTNRATNSNSSTRIISNHMMHSSTPLSKYMMNQATPPGSPRNLQLSNPHQSSSQNKQKAAEMWATRGHEVPLEISLHQSSPLEVPTSRGFYYNSLPRPLPESCHFQPIESYPSLSISSPSLFGTSPESSLTPSPTTTVLKNYNTASPNP